MEEAIEESSLRSMPIEDIKALLSSLKSHYENLEQENVSL